MNMIKFDIFFDYYFDFSLIKRCFYAAVERVSSGISMQVNANQLRFLNIFVYICLQEPLCIILQIQYININSPFHAH